VSVSAEAAKRESGYVCVCVRVAYAEHRLTDASCSSERERKEQTVGRHSPRTCQLREVSVNRSRRHSQKKSQLTATFAIEHSKNTLKTCRLLAVPKQSATLHTLNGTRLSTTLTLEHSRNTPTLPKHTNTARTHEEHTKTGRTHQHSKNTRRQLNTRRLLAIPKSRLHATLTRGHG